MQEETAQSIEEELGKYEDQWVAIFEPDQKIVASGCDAYEAKQNAIANGYPKVRLLRVPRFDTTYAFGYHRVNDLSILSGQDTDR